MNTNGSGVVHLRSGIQPSFSSDGTKIVFKGSGTNYGGIRIMNSNGSGLIQLTNLSTDEASRFSPDGSKIAFFPIEMEQGQTNLSNNVARDVSPGFSPILCSKRD